MRRFAILLLWSLPLGLVCTTASGCKQNSVEEDEIPQGGKYVLNAGPEVIKAEPIKAASMDGVVTGRVVYDGTPPEMPPIAAMATHKDACLSGAPFEKREQKWIVGKDNAVGNVVLWLNVPKGKFFELKPEDKDRSKEEIILDQPHCVFIPHVVAVFPSYFDGKEQKSTGQVFKSKNSAGFTHNTRWSGDESLGNSGSVTLSSGADKAINFTPGDPTGKDVINFGCDVHPWMAAKGFVFDNPYHDVTRVLDPKRADGSFEIKNLPTGVDINLVFWHEAKGEFMPFKSFKLSQGEKKDLGDVKIKE